MLAFAGHVPELLIGPAAGVRGKPGGANWRRSAMRMIGRTGLPNVGAVRAKTEAPREREFRQGTVFPARLFPLGYPLESLWEYVPPGGLEPPRWLPNNGF